MNNIKATKKIAIITGASSGLGGEFALQLEKRFFFDEVWMIARRAEPMREIADRFQKSKAVIIPLDLTNDGDLAVLQKKIVDEQPEISFLVNNAGYGKIGPFMELGLEEQMQMVDLNIKALLFLTKVALPWMKPGGRILQVASSIAYAPAPYFAVYAATKSFVLSFSDALSFELKNHGISVTAVCPGPVSTEFFSVAQKNESMKGKVADVEPFNQSIMANAKDVVAKAIKDAEKEKRESIYGFPINFFVKSIPFIPKSIAMKILADGRKK